LTTATVGRGARALGHIRWPRITARRVCVLIALLVVLLVGWLWFRSSSLVSVKQVTVTGLNGQDASQIRSALTDEALTMTTLDISRSKLENAVSGYSHIAGVSVSTHFPHTVTINVDETIPVASVEANGRQVAVDGAGLLLPSVSTSGLARLSIAPDTGGARVTSAGTLATLSVLAAAPYQLLPHIASAKSSLEHGVTVQLRNGPVIYFGNTTQLQAKWTSADAVLASSDSAGASYIDVTAPGRSSAGTGN
jgi:cell division protein FtsQ